MQSAVYENSLLFLIACTIPYAAMVHTDPRMAIMVAWFSFSLIAFFCLFFPPRKQHTFLVLLFEFTFINEVLWIHMPDHRKFLVPLVIGSCVSYNILLAAMMSIRGLTLKDMGILGRINIAALDGLCVVLNNMTGNIGLFDDFD